MAGLDVSESHRERVDAAAGPIPTSDLDQIDDVLCSTFIDPEVKVEEWHCRTRDLTNISVELYSICCVARGRGVISVNGDSYTGGPGSLFYLAPGDKIRAVPLPAQELVLHICRFRVRSQATFALLTPPAHTRVQDPHLVDDLRDLVRSSRDAGRSQFAAWLLIYNVLGYWRSKKLLRLSESAREPALATLERVFSYMNTSTDGITMDRLARVACREKSFLYRLFREHLQTTPIHYYRHLQMLKVKRLLLEGRSLKELAADFGYSDAFSLSKAFKNCFGVSPGLLWPRSSHRGHLVDRAEEELGATATGVWDLHPSLLLLRRRALRWSPGRAKVDWEGCFGAQGIITCGKELGDAEMLAWGAGWADYHLSVPVQEIEPSSSAWQSASDGTRGIVLTGYAGSWAPALALAPLYEARRKVEYSRAITTIAQYVLRRALRTDDGTIVHGGFTRNVWVDTPCFASGALARSYAITRAKEDAREAVSQCILHARYLRDERTGCFVHDADAGRGLRSRWLWARGNGLMLLAIADTLSACPESTIGFGQLLGVFRSLADGLAGFQHPSGLWRIILDDPDSHLETSGSAVILSGMAIGMRHGWLPGRMRPLLLRGFRELLSWIHPESGKLQGAFMGSERPAGPGGWNSHKCIEMGECVYATGMFLRLLGEMKLLGVIARR